MSKTGGEMTSSSPAHSPFFEYIYTYGVFLTRKRILAYAVARSDDGESGAGGGICGDTRRAGDHGARIRKSEMKLLKFCCGSIVSTATEPIPKPMKYF